MAKDPQAESLAKVKRMQSDWRKTVIVQKRARANLEKAVKASAAKGTRLTDIARTLGVQRPSVVAIVERRDR